MLDFLEILEFLHTVSNLYATEICKYAKNFFIYLWLWYTGDIGMLFCAW